MSHDYDPPGMSTTTKVIIALVAAGCVGLVLCCGGVWWLGRQVQGIMRDFAEAIEEMVTEDPEEIAEITASIVSIEVPEDWQPQVGMQWQLFFEMTMVGYGPDRTRPNRMLILMQMRGAGASQEEMEQQLRMQSQQQRQQQGMDPDFTATSSETRTFEIDGVERDFLFSTGTDSAGNTLHQVSGVFPGRGGTVMLMFTEDGDNWDEDAVVRMIESITTEGPAAPPEEADHEPSGSSAETTAPPVEATAPPAEETAPAGEPGDPVENDR